MEFTPVQPIRPLWDSLSQPEQAGRTPAGTLFANVFQAAIDNVRETSAVQANLEYELATGQIDNPAELNLAISKATAAAELLIQMRNKALDAYNELMRISI